jgi:hypothetical protein
MQIYKMALSKTEYDLYKCVDDQGFGKVMRVPVDQFAWMDTEGKPNDFKMLKLQLEAVWTDLGTDFQMVLNEIGQPVFQNVVDESEDKIR